MITKQAGHVRAAPDLRNACCAAAHGDIGRIVLRHVHRGDSQLARCAGGSINADLLTFVQS
jgi:hypothetical protein